MTDRSRSFATLAREARHRFETICSHHARLNQLASFYTPLGRPPPADAITFALFRIDHELTQLRSIQAQLREIGRGMPAPGALRYALWTFIDDATGIVERWSSHLAAARGADLAVSPHSAVKVFQAGGMVAKANADANAMSPSAGPVTSSMLRAVLAANSPAGGAALQTPGPKAIVERLPPIAMDTAAWRPQYVTRFSQRLADQAARREAADAAALQQARQMAARPSPVPARSFAPAIPDSGRLPTEAERAYAEARRKEDEATTKWKMQMLKDQLAADKKRSTQRSIGLAKYYNAMAGKPIYPTF